MQNLKQRTLYSGLLFLAVFFALLPWIFLDVDQGDQAYSTLHAWLLAFVVRPEMPPGYWHDSTPIWGSLFLGSLWWKVIGSQAGLLAFRFGWIALNIITAQVLYWVFSNVYSEKKTFIAIFLTTLIANCAADHFVITYNSVGPAMGAISFGLLCLSFSLHRPIPKTFFIFLSGFLAIITISAKLPSIPFVILFFLLSILLHYYQQRKILSTLSFAFVYGFGCLVSSLFLFYVLKNVNQWSMYQEGFSNFFLSVAADTDAKYSKAATLGRVFGHYSKITFGAFLFLLLSSAISFTKGNLQKLVGLILLLFFVYLVGTKYGMALSTLIGASVILAALSTFKDFKQLRAEKMIFFFAGGLVLTAFTFGTFLEGLQNYKYGMWILFPFAFLELENIQIKFIDRKKISSYLILSAVALFLVTRIQWPTFPYFENPIFAMNKSFQVPTLAGIKSYDEKVKSYDSLYSFLSSKGVGNGTSMMAYAAAPPLYPVALIYLITKTIPPFHSPTMTEYPGFMWAKHKKTIEELLKENKFVDLVVRQKEPFPIRQNGLYSLNPVSTQIAPAAELKPFSWDSIESLGPANELDLLLKAKGYHAIWEDNHWVVLAK